MDTNDNLGDRMKLYESAETERHFDTQLPLVVRLDGRAFSTFTNGFVKPFDANLTAVMQNVTRFLIEKTHAVVGYHQSDEITLIYDACEGEAQPIFNGRSFKIMSVLAGMASSRFAVLAMQFWPERVRLMTPSFDCRAFNVPTRSEAINALIWRENDASRNAIQMVAQANFSPKQLHGKSCARLEDMLATKAIFMVDFPNCYRFGSYFARRTRPRELTAEELSAIPEAHRPTGPVMRSSVEELDIGKLRLKTHDERLDIIFNSRTR